jgi:exoribonuclease R
MLLWRLAGRLRSSRFAAGSLKLDKPRLQFELDPLTGRPRACYPYITKEANFLVEEFMLLANQVRLTKNRKKYKHANEKNKRNHCFPCILPLPDLPL